MPILHSEKLCVSWAGKRSARPRTMNKKLLSSLVLSIYSLSTFAQDQLPEERVAENIGDKVNGLFEPVVGFLAQVFFWDPVKAVGLDIGTDVPIIVVWLVIGAIYFTFKMNFINVRGFKHSIDLVQGKYDDPNDKGEVSHFQALTTALSATVGLGNIASVAVAITLGGPGATFWMIVAGFLGMSTKFTECTLGVKYREIDEEGNVICLRESIPYSREELFFVRHDGVVGGGGRRRKEENRLESSSSQQHQLLIYYYALSRSLAPVLGHFLRSLWDVGIVRLRTSMGLIL